MFGKMKYRDTTSGPQSHPEDVEIWKPETAANGFFFLIRNHSQYLPDLQEAETGRSLILRPTWST